MVPLQSGRGCSATARRLLILLALLPATPVLGLSTPGSAASQPASAPAEAPDAARATLTLEQLAPLPKTSTSAPAEERPLSDRGAQYLKRSQELMSQERYSEAGRELEKALRSDPTRYEIHRALALAMYRAGNAERAGSHARQSLQYKPGDILPHYLLGRMALDQSLPAAAAESLRRALECPDIADAPDLAALTHAALGRALEAEGYLTAALAAYRAYAALAATLSPDVVASNPELTALVRVDGGSAAGPISQILERLDRPAEAAEALAPLMAQGDVAGPVRTRYARLLAAARRFDEAIAECRKLALQEDDPAPHLALMADIRKQAGDESRALADIQALIAERPGNAPLVRAQVDLLGRLNRADEAGRVLAEYLSVHPGASEMAWSLFDLHLRAGRTADAFELACRTVTAHEEAQAVAIIKLDELAKSPAGLDPIWAREWPDAAVTQALLGVLALRSGRIEQGVNGITQALGASPSLSSARFVLAEHCLQEYRWQDAIDLVGSFNGQDANLEWVLGEAYAGLDDDEKAADHYSAAVRLNRVDTRSMFALAKLYERTGHGLRARRQYESVIEADPLHEAAREALLNLLVNERQHQEAQAQLAELRKRAPSSNRLARCVARLELVGPGGSMERYRQTLNDAMASAGPDPESLALVAVSLLSEGDAPSAEAPLRRALELDPRNVQASELLIPVLSQQLRFGEAADVLRGLLRRNPHRLEWIKRLGIELRKDQQYEAAAAVLSAALERDSLPAEGRQEFREDLLNVLGAAGKHAERIALLKEWLRKNESDASVRLNLLNALLAAKDFAGALEWSRKWFEAEPANEQVISMHREVLLRTGRHVPALQFFLSALEDDPANEGMLLGFALALSEAKRHDDALEVIEGELGDPGELNRNITFLRAKLAVLTDARRFEDAAIQVGRMLQDATLTDDDGPFSVDELQLMLARVLFNAERYNEAQTRLTRWEERAETDEARFDYLLVLAGIYQQKALPDRAVECLEKAYALNPHLASINNDLGYTLAEAGRKMADAERMVRLAVGREPENAAYLDSLGWVLYRRGRFADARAWLGRAARNRLEEEDPVIFDHLGDACWRALAQTEAVEHWKRAVALAEERLKEREDATHRKVLESAVKKLAAVEADEPPPVAEVVKEEAAAGAESGAVPSGAAQPGAEPAPANQPPLLPGSPAPPQSLGPWVPRCKSRLSRGSLTRSLVHVRS